MANLSPIRYVRLTLHEGQRFYLRVEREDENFITGMEVDREGEEVVPPGHHNRQRIVQKGAIKRSVEMRMNTTYCTLEKTNG